MKTVVLLIIGAAFGEFLDALNVPNVSIPSWVFFGLSGIAFLILALVFLALRNDTKRLIDKSSISFDVVEEKVAGDGTISGSVYSKLAELFANAEQEILVFNYPRKVRVHSLESENSKIMPSKVKRLEWLNAELETLNRYQNTRFKYVMIIQSPDEKAPLTEIVDSDIANSLRKMFSLQMANHSPNYVIDVRRANTEFVNPFVVIDERYLTVPLYGIKGEIMYIDKIFVFEDKEGTLIRTFKSYFESMERKATRVTLEDMFTAQADGQVQ
ncbi:MAG: hypothetical protein IPM53_18100 [Anaerolineaceae bacterium]|nr:hypothetical protein [Anaerolineaceae bacterium]